MIIIASDHSYIVDTKQIGHIFIEDTHTGHGCESMILIDSGSFTKEIFKGTKAECENIMNDIIKKINTENQSWHEGTLQLEITPVGTTFKPYTPRPMPTSDGEPSEHTP